MMMALQTLILLLVLMCVANDVINLDVSELSVQYHMETAVMHQPLAQEQ